MANFYNISNKLDKNYDLNEYITIDDDELHEKVISYLSVNNNIKTGDIIFIGSTYETRQYYGFIMVDKRDGISYVTAEEAVSLPFENINLKDYLIKNKIKYGQLFNNLNEKFSLLSCFLNEKEEVQQDYQNIGLW
tara:strand:- start:671 stop:1075 length:405 start_codon:yes stop_codon:yes gene_type:complete